MINKKWLIGLGSLLLVGSVNADLISINGGGSNNLVVHSGSLIEKFFFGALGVITALSTCELSIIGGMLGLGLLLLYLANKIEDEHEPVRQLLYLTSLLFGVVGIYLIIPISQDTSVSNVALKFWNGVIITFVTISSLFVINILIKTTNLLRSNVR